MAKAGIVSLKQLREDAYVNLEKKFVLTTQSSL